MNRTPEIEATIDELRKHGAEVTGVVQSKKHVRVYFARQGQTRFVVCPVSGSDWRGPMNARKTVRREIGLKRGKKVGARRPRKNSTEHTAIEAPDHITVGRDWAAPLRLNAAMKMHPDQAWAGYFATLLRDNGHRPVNPLFHSARHPWADASVPPDAVGELIPGSPTPDSAAGVV